MTRFCEFCGHALPVDCREDQRFCSDKSTCRVAAWRQRKRVRAVGLMADDVKTKVFFQR